MTVELPLSPLTLNAVQAVAVLERRSHPPTSSLNEDAERAAEIRAIQEAASDLYRALVLEKATYVRALLVVAARALLAVEAVEGQQTGT